MMKLLNPLAFALFGLLALPLAAEDLLVDYFDGTVEFRVAQGAWKPLTEGLLVSADAQVRVKDGVAEFLVGKRRLHLSKNGTYQLSDLLKAPQASAGALTTLAGQKLNKLIGANPTARVVVAQGGVRGDEQSGGGALEWSDDEPTPAASLETLLADEDWPGALKAVDEALAHAGDDAMDLWVTKARILAAMGRSGAALVAVDRSGVQPGQTPYLQAVLIVASAGLDAADYQRVVDRTAEALKRNLDDELAQTLTLAQALAYQGLGDKARYQSQLNAAVKLGPNTPAGAEARRLGGK